MLHDQCRTPGASDKNFAMSMYEKCASHQRFEADSRQVAEQLFAVHHYAGLVEYNVDGFVEKNRDELPKEATDLLLSSNNEFVQTLAKILQPQSQFPSGNKLPMSPRSGPSKGASQRPTVGIQFSSQLHSLRRKIDDTAPHYVRCLKPNNLLVPNLFDAALIADQLRCAGVIEAVRVSRLGYPQRYSHNQFITRYRILGLKALRKKKNAKKFNPAKALAHAVTEQLNTNSREDSGVGIQVGKTKVFLKRQAYDMLEKLRRCKLTSSTITIQKSARKYIYTKRYVAKCHSVLIIQSFARQIFATKVVSEKRRLYNSVLIQKTWRNYAAMKIFESTKIIALWCQAQQRGATGRSKYNGLNRERKAMYLQTRLRGFVAVKTFRLRRHSVVILQCAWRSYVARKELSALKSEARDFQAVARERDMLRKEAHDLRNELKTMKEKPSVDSTEMEATLKGVRSSMSEKDAEIRSLWKQLEKALREKETMEVELEASRMAVSNTNAERALAISECDGLKAANERLQMELVNASDNSDAELKVVSAELLRAKKEKDQVCDEIELLKNANKDLEKQFKVLKNEQTSNKREHQSLAVVGIDNSKELELLPKALAEIKQLKNANAALQNDIDQLKNEHLTLQNSTVAANDDTSVGKYTPKTSETTDEKLLDDPFPSVCTSLTVDMTETEEESSKLREENQRLRKELTLLRTNYEDLAKQLDCSDQEYDNESVNPDGEDSIYETSESGTEYIGDAVSERVMKQICSEVEEATGEIVMKTRAEAEAKVTNIQKELNELQLVS